MHWCDIWTRLYNGSDFKWACIHMGRWRVLLTVEALRVYNAVHITCFKDHYAILVDPQPSAIRSIIRIVLMLHS